jgi:Cof subfamily protein (haloacid dehalogenase superfamily)
MQNLRTDDIQAVSQHNRAVKSTADAQRRVLLEDSYTKPAAVPVVLPREPLPTDEPRQQHHDEKPYNTVALDLDGTLLNSSHVVSDKTRSYLQELHARGITIIIATGRAAPSVYDTVKSLSLPTPIPVVCSNGSKGMLCRVVNHSENGGDDVSTTPLFDVPVPLDITERALQLANKLGHVLQYYHGDQIYANPTCRNTHYELTHKYSELTGSKITNVQDNYQELLAAKKLPSKLLVLCPESQLKHAWKAFQEEFRNDEATLVYGSLGWFLEILHPTVHKGAGLVRMCQELPQCSGVESVVAFGDGDNDIEFLQYAGRGVVMKNGRMCVKQVADEITLYTNNEVSFVCLLLW